MVKYTELERHTIRTNMFTYMGCGPILTPGNIWHGSRHLISVGDRYLAIFRGGGTQNGENLPFPGPR